MRLAQKAQSILFPLFIAVALLATFNSGVASASERPKGPHLPIRLMNYWTFGSGITKWIEPGTENFAQIHWVNANLSRYDFDSANRPAEFIAGVDASRNKLRGLAEQVQRLGLRAYLNEYELNFPEFIPRQSLITPESRRKFMEEKVYELFVQCPWLDGYMITPTESKLGAANPEELKAVVLGAHAGMKRAEKKLGARRYLFVRSWLSAAANLAKVRAYFPITRDPEIAREIIIVSKDGLGDFVMRRPLNPLFGAVQPHSILAEVDVSVSEYRSLGWYPQGPAEMWAGRIQELVQIPGVVGINIHTGRLTEIAGRTPEQAFPAFKDGKFAYGFHGGVKWNAWHHLNVITMFELLKNPWKPGPQIYKEWAAENYGAKAAEPLARILSLANDALYHGMLTYGVNLNNHSGFIENFRAPIEGMQKALTYQLKLQPNLAVLLEPSLDITDRVLAEKAEANRLVEAMIGILDDGKSAFVPADYQSIRTDLLKMRAALKGYEIVQGGYFAYQMAISDPPVANRKYYIAVVKRLVAEAEPLANSPLEFLHQRTNRSFSYFSRAMREGLQARNLW